MKPTKFIILALGTLLLSGCQTLTGAFDSVEGTVESVFASDRGNTRLGDNPIQALSYECPRITILHELSELTEFTTNITNDKDNIISSASMELNDKSCEINNENLIVDLSLLMKSKLGPKAKIKDNDRPFFSYPFFVAVSNIRGEVLAKEVFAASMTYDRKEESHSYYENIRQIIPMEKRNAVSSYKIYVGFQLSDDQLAYNRSYMTPPPPPIEETQQEEPKTLFGTLSNMVSDDEEEQPDPLGAPEPLVKPKPHEIHE